VQIKLIIRGICVLKNEPEHKNIQAFGVVDRFLEHSRVFVFSNAGEPQYYISSADLMSRNLDHRIEVACPILSEEHQIEIQDIIDIQLQDNVKARHLQADKINEYVSQKQATKHQSQLEIYEYLRKKAESI
jgi:polyphosphate kinase